MLNEDQDLEMKPSPAPDEPLTEEEWPTLLGDPSDSGLLLDSGGKGAGPTYDPPKLHKVLADAGIGSRREMEELILAGRVSVNGTPAHIGQRITHTDQVKVNGKPIRIAVEPPPVRVLAYHKPAGEIVTKSDPQQRVTVFRQLPPVRYGRWITVGRLDVSTEGLLLFTTSGELANRLMHPRNEVEREYAVRVLGELSDEARAQLSLGITLDDGEARFERIEEAGGDGANRWWRVAIREGRNREVRRMFEHVGLTVSRLIRIRYGLVQLPPGLKRGQSVDLSQEAVAALMQSVGLKGRASGAARKSGGRAKARTRPDPAKGRGPRAPQAFQGPMSSESRLAMDPHDRALDAEDFQPTQEEDEWQPSGPDAHLSHLGGAAKRRQGGRKPNPLQTTWGTAKPGSGSLSAPQRTGGAGRPGGDGPKRNGPKRSSRPRKGPGGGGPTA